MYLWQNWSASPSAIVREMHSTSHDPKPWQFAGIRVQDIAKAPMVIADMRKLIRQDQRIIQRLHRRVFLDKVTREQITIYISFYVEAANRDAFMSVKQDLLLAFMECIDRNGAYLAKNRIQVPLPLHSFLAHGLQRDRHTLQQFCSKFHRLKQCCSLPIARSEMSSRSDRCARWCLNYVKEIEPFKSGKSFL